MVMGDRKQRDFVDLDVRGKLGGQRSQATGSGFAQ